MSEEILTYTDLAAVIQMAKGAGLSIPEIVRALTRGMTHAEALKFAKKAAPLLDIEEEELMRMRKNN